MKGSSRGKEKKKFVDHRVLEGQIGAGLVWEEE